MDFEEEYLDVFQNIEFAIVSVYKEEPETSDFDVENALNAVMLVYRAELRNREPSSRKLTPTQTKIYDRVMGMCDWRLGRADNPEIPNPEPISVKEIVDCLKRIRKSVQFWTKEAGRQGYLTYISNFIR